MVVMPLKPEFPEEWDKKTGSDLRAVSYWTYATIYSGKDSLFNRLKEKKIPAEAIPQYFSVYGLRTYGSLNGNLVTEIIYVHSKLMIVDDRLAIIGSANINDRSMLGDRDSEVAVIIQDNDLMEGTMNGQPYQVGQFSHSLRCHLLREHLGLLSERNATPLNVEDPLTTISTISKLAVENTLIYEQVFHGRILPTNQGLADFSLEKAEKELEKIQGSIVVFPSLFLKDVLKPSFLDYVDMYVDTRGRTRELNFDDTTAGTFFA
ncbi:hypothetical protein OS493_034411 [Desmophyllum pertusum]|uniref:phospholipase D n=1 Tax=Desmophyllum pertusum TaxID=174260 RepID=A0A9W9ZJE2_9CNID|nr:hypothetical protein OS493_034411 [Desmophyllum pertusum]